MQEDLFLKQPKLNVMNVEENSQYEGYARECVFQIYAWVQNISLKTYALPLDCNWASQRFSLQMVLNPLG